MNYFPLLFAATFLSGKAPQPASVVEKAVGILGDHASGWRIVAVGEHSVSFVNDERTVRERNTVRAWILTVHVPSTKTSNGKLFGSSMSYNEIDCSESRSRTLDLILYSKQNRSGDVVFQNSDAFAEWARAIPGSILEAEILSVCEPTNKTRTYNHPSLRAPSFYFLQSSDGQSNSALSGDCTFVENMGNTVDCKISQVGFKSKVSPVNLPTEVKKIRQEFEKEDFDAAAMSETCRMLSEARGKATGPLALQRLEIFESACRSNSKEAWSDAAAASLELDTRVCKIYTIDSGPFRFSADADGNWSTKSKVDHCDQTMEIVLTAKDGYVSEYRQTRRRNSSDPKCKEIAKIATQKFSHAPAIPATCSEIEFGF